MPREPHVPICAIETSDIVLMMDDLTKIPYIITLEAERRKKYPSKYHRLLLIFAFLVPATVYGWTDLMHRLQILTLKLGGFIVKPNGLGTLEWLRNKTSEAAPLYPSLRRRGKETNIKFEVQTDRTQQKKY